jgi:hypothetical protein
VVFSDQGLANAVLWYADRNGSAGERLRHPHLRPDKDKAGLFFVAGGGFGHLAQKKAEFFAARGEEPHAIAESVGTRTYYFELPRQPVHPLGALPVRFHERLTPASFYAGVESLENVSSLPLWGGGLIATDNDAPGQATFAFANTAPVPQRIEIFLGFADTAAGNRLTVAYSFDDGPWEEGLVLDTPLGEGDAHIRVERRQPYARLRLRFTLFCGSRTPMYPGGNLESLRLKDFKLYIDPLETAQTP